MQFTSVSAIRAIYESRCRTHRQLETFIETELGYSNEPFLVGNNVERATKFLTLSEYFSQHVYSMATADQLRIYQRHNYLSRIELWIAAPNPAADISVEINQSWINILSPKLEDAVSRGIFDVARLGSSYFGDPLGIYIWIKSNQTFGSTMYMGDSKSESKGCDSARLIPALRLLLPDLEKQSNTIVQNNEINGFIHDIENKLEAKLGRTVLVNILRDAGISPLKWLGWRRRFF